MNSELELVKIDSLIYEATLDEDSLEEEFPIGRSTHTINSGNLKRFSLRLKICRRSITKL
jgi:hypothetical protein